MGKKLWITLGILALLLLSVGTILYFTGIIPQGMVGFSTIALQSADLESTSDYFNGKAWVLTVRLGGLGQSAYGKFTPSNIQEQTSDQTTTKKDFKLTIDQQDQQCVYPIQSTSSLTPISNYAIITWAYVPLINPCSEEEANSRGATSVTYFGKNFGLTCWAIYKTGEQSPVGNFGNTDLRARMNVNIEAGDRSGSRELDTEGSIQGAISDFAYVIWQGNLDTGKSCSYTTDMPYRPAYVNGNWRLINKNAYENYRAFAVTQPSPDPIPSLWVDDVNKLVNLARVSNSFGSFDNPTSFNNAILRADLKSPIQNPVLTFYIKAETLGIYTPAPEIELSQATSDCFKTGENGIIKVTAKNIGDESGVWNFFGDCQGSFDITESREYGLSAGQERQVSLPLSATSTARQTSTCTIYAESPAGTKQINVNVCVDPQQTCTPNKKFCGTSGGSDVIKQCSSSGAESSIIEICASGETCEIKSGEPKCVSGGGGTGFWDWFTSLFGDLGKTINDFIFKFKLLFSIAIGIIGLLIGWGYSRNLIPMFGIMTTQEISKKMWIPVILGLLTGIILGLLAYWYFWIILIVIVVLGIIKIFI